ncbi:transcription elongation factor GreAB [Arenibacter sp. TNZ]|uniref:GreA/GreB family elongation factor n=1 Tax=Arenibacter TaxID=178469 RepID=UPI000CD4724B|nr:MULTISPECIES: GreA/GreB family elongation factor [Arenibacter]MCM4172349.1 transcription elongation factor GreAB [Arenibacter sp. TNZ]
MKYKNLIIEKKEYVVLKRFMNLSGYYKDVTLRKSVEKLLGELESAQICDEMDMPKDVIRFNSKINIGSENGWRRKFQLVMPNDSDVKNDKVSILTPMGAAVIGYAESDSLSWEFPSGEQKLTIEKVEQENKYINVNMIL